jgi:hypothetical protein
MSSGSIVFIKTTLASFVPGLQRQCATAVKVLKKQTDLFYGLDAVQIRQAGFAVCDERGCIRLRKLQIVMPRFTVGKVWEQRRRKT